MELFFSLIYILMCITYIYWCIRFGKKGYRYVRGKDQYKPWLPADDSLNWKFGLTLLVATIVFGLACSIILVNSLLQMLWDTEGVFLELACFSFPVLLICGIYLYIFNQEIGYLKPKQALLDEKINE